MIYFLIGYLVIGFILAIIHKPFRIAAILTSPLFAIIMAINSIDFAIKYAIGWVKIKLAIRRFNQKYWFLKK